MSKVNLPTKIYRGILRILPIKSALYLIYFRGYKKILDLKNPKTWGEKIQWLKLYGGLEELSPYVDKYEVRNYVKNTIGEEYLNELIGVYDDVESINFDKLPNEFVLKSTNGSGTVLICNNKKNFDIIKAKKVMKCWLKDKNYYKEKKEFQYKNIKNRIIIEKYLQNKNNSLTDYKFYCFNGKVEYYAIFYDRYTNKSIDIYDKDNNKIKDAKVCNIPNSNYEIEDYHIIEKMKKLSEKLSKIFSCVRVDFYCIDDKPIFGELTFTDGAGSDPWNPKNFDLNIAKKIKLKKIISEGK